MSDDNVLDAKRPQIAWRDCDVYNVEQLWALTQSRVPTQMKIQDLLPMLDEDFWEDPNDLEGPSVTPRQVIDGDREYFREHWRRIDKADYKRWPLLVHWDGVRWDIIDGLHRFVRAYLDKQETVSVQVLDDATLASVCMDE